MQTPTRSRRITLAEIDDALTECAKRLRLAKASKNREAVTVYTAQINRLLGWRHELTAGDP